jgi:DNA mismatch repair protein MutS2
LGYNLGMLSAELDLHALTVEEALPKLAKYLDGAYLAGLNRVVIIHGKGTGTLREAVRHYLGKHTLVKAFRPGGYGEGDEGVTIVEL